MLVVACYAIYQCDPHEIQDGSLHRDYYLRVSKMSYLDRICNSAAGDQARNVISLTAFSFLIHFTP